MTTAAQVATHWSRDAWRGLTRDQRRYIAWCVGNGKVVGDSALWASWGVSYGVRQLRMLPWLYGAVIAIAAGYMTWAIARGEASDVSPVWLGGFAITAVINARRLGLGLAANVDALHRHRAPAPATTETG